MNHRGQVCAGNCNRPKVKIHWRPTAGLYQGWSACTDLFARKCVDVRVGPKTFS